MKAKEIRIARRKAGLAKWELALILKISEGALRDYERGTRPIPPEVALAVEAETERQHGRIYYGEGPRVINALVSENISITRMAEAAAATKAKIRSWWGGRSDPTPEQLQALLEMEGIRRAGIKRKKKARRSRKLTQSTGRRSK